MCFFLVISFLRLRLLDFEVILGFFQKYQAIDFVNCKIFWPIIYSICVRIIMIECMMGLPWTKIEKFPMSCYWLLVQCCWQLQLVTILSWNNKQYGLNILNRLNTWSNIRSKLSDGPRPLLVWERNHVKIYWKF